MSPKGYQNNYREITPPKEGLQYHRSQLTKLAVTKGKLLFNCDYCELPFEKYACWAKRSKHHYCSRACSHASKIVRFPKNCVVCGTEMLVTPSSFNSIYTCSRVCLRKKRVKNNHNLRSSPDYVAIARQLKKDAQCKICGTLKGPWAVAGIKTWVEDGLACAEGSGAYLACSHCHLTKVSTLAVTSTYIADRPKYYMEKNT